MTDPHRRGVIAWLCVAGPLLASCSDSGPAKVDALAAIAERIRKPYGMGEKQLQNLVYASGSSLGEGRYAVLVDYDLVGTMPEMALFSTKVEPGSKTHIAGERYVFTRAGSGWSLE